MAAKWRKYQEQYKGLLAVEKARPSRFTAEPAWVSCYCQERKSGQSRQDEIRLGSALHGKLQRCYVSVCILLVCCLVFTSQPAVRLFRKPNEKA